MVYVRAPRAKRVLGIMLKLCLLIWPCYYSQKYARIIIASLTSFIRGHHVYCQEWTPAVGEVLALKRQPDNSHDKFAVAVIKNGRIVGHIPKSMSRAVSFFLNRDGHSGFCEVTARPTNRGVDLGVEVPCTYRFYGRQSYIDRLNQLLQ